MPSIVKALTAVASISNPMMSNEFAPHLHCGFSLHPKAVTEEVTNITAYCKHTTVSVWAWSLTGLMCYVFAVATVFYLGLWNSCSGIVWWTSLFLMEPGKRADWHTVVLVDFRAPVWTDISPKSSRGKSARFRLCLCQVSPHCSRFNKLSLCWMFSFPSPQHCLYGQTSQWQHSGVGYSMSAFVHVTQGRWFGWRGSSL